MLTKTEKCIIRIKITTMYLLRFSLATILVFGTYNIIDYIFMSNVTDNEEL